MMAAEKRKVEDDFDVLAKKIRVEEEETPGQSEELNYAEGHNLELKERETLRVNIQLWLERYPVLSSQTACIAIKDLLSLRNIEDKRYGEWNREVLNLRDVQRNLTYAAHYSRNTFDEQEKRDIVSALIQILHPFDRIETRYFPTLREILEELQELEYPIDLDFMEELNAIQVAEFSRNVATRIPKKTCSREAYLKDSQKKLELMMKHFTESGCDVYEYLLSIGVLQVFGFKIHQFQFDYNLSGNDFKNISKLLEDHINNFNLSLQLDQQQAYILNLALCCVDQKETAVRHVFDRMSGELLTELREVCAQTLNGFVDDKVLHNAVDELLSEEQKKLNEQTLVYNIKSQLHELEGCEVIEVVKTEEKEAENLNPRVQLWLEILDMKKYYPQKLQYENVIKLRTEDFDDANKTCTNFRQLP